MYEMPKNGAFRVNYVLRINGLDNELGTSTVIFSDFDRLITQATAVSQDPDSGLITLTGEGFSIELDPDSKEATIVRSFS